MSRHIFSTVLAGVALKSTVGSSAARLMNSVTHWVLPGAALNALSPMPALSAHWLAILISFNAYSSAVSSPLSLIEISIWVSLCLFMKGIFALDQLCRSVCVHLHNSSWIYNNVHPQTAATIALLSIRRRKMPGLGFGAWCLSKNISRGHFSIRTLIANSYTSLTL